MLHTINNRLTTEKYSQLHQRNYLPDDGYKKELPGSGWQYEEQSDEVRVIGFKSVPNKDGITFKNDVLEAKKELENLAPNWDDNGALKPDYQNIDNAIHFLDKAFEKLLLKEDMDLDLPEINACPDGSIDVVWRLSKAFMLINFRNPKSKIAHFYFDQYREELGRQGGIELDKPLPDDVLSYLAALAR